MGVEMSYISYILLSIGYIFSASVGRGGLDGYQEL